ncbi:hypothetical protein HUJ04_005220 [Dendroctonus ponderosae]|nr:hypothetical protein HUJ04_005220 [Dendroctonus ponderosae]
MSGFSSHMVLRSSSSEYPFATPELNRLRKAAVTLGFHELLIGLAFIFEQECMQLPGTAHPDCALQLHHAADMLRKTQKMDVKYVLMPLQTTYNT